jgi:hypothetical protein
MQLGGTLAEISHSWVDVSFSLISRILDVAMLQKLRFVPLTKRFNQPFIYFFREDVKEVDSDVAPPKVTVVGVDLDKISLSPFK